MQLNNETTVDVTYLLKLFLLRQCPWKNIEILKRADGSQTSYKMPRL